VVAVKPAEMKNKMELKRKERALARSFELQITG
jgi:hypothetical protein